MKIQNQIDQWFKKLLLVIKKWFKQKKMMKKFFLPPATPPSKSWPFLRFLVKIRCAFSECLIWIWWIMGLLKSFAFLMWCICGACFKNWLTNPIKGYYAHTGCPKNPKLPYFGAKMEIHRYDQNIWSPEMFCLYDVVDLSSLI